MYDLQTELKSTSRVASAPRPSPLIPLPWLSQLASVKITVALLVLIAATVLVGAWCPQESQVGPEKVIEQFGSDVAFVLMRWGITDIFHSPWFLLLIGLLTVNMIACSWSRVFPKLRALKLQMPFVDGGAIGKLPVSEHMELHGSTQDVLQKLAGKLRRAGYKVNVEAQNLTAESGKFGRLASTVTHVGLLTLLAGVSISSWSGFSGFESVPVGGELNFARSQHSKLWFGTLPDWHVRVDASRREDYPSGEPKQWYSDLTVVDRVNSNAGSKLISVNDPLSYKGVDIYQSSWALDSLLVSFNGHSRRLELREMGNAYAAFLPLEPGVVLIFSVASPQEPLHLFLRTDKWQVPKRLGEIMPGKTIQLSTVNLTYQGVVPATGLQYKCDPGIPVIYLAFGFIMLGVLLAAVPHCQVWAYAVDQTPALRPGLIEQLSRGGTSRRTGLQDHAGNVVVSLGQDVCVLSLGGRSLKAKTAFEKSLCKVIRELKTELGAKT